MIGIEISLLVFECSLHFLNKFWGYAQYHWKSKGYHPNANLVELLVAGR